MGWGRKTSKQHTKSTSLFVYKFITQSLLRIIKDLQQERNRSLSFCVKISLGFASSEHSEMVASNEVGSSIGENTSAIVMPWDGLALVGLSSINLRHILI